MPEQGTERWESSARSLVRGRGREARDAEEGRAPKENDTGSMSAGKRVAGARTPSPHFLYIFASQALVPSASLAGLAGSHLSF